MVEKKEMFQVEFEPIGRRVNVPSGASLLDAARDAGVALTAVCGGGGTCGDCRVRLLAGEISPANAVELSELTGEERADGLRLACQCEVRGNVRVHVPSESLAAAQRLQLEAHAGEVALDPPVRSMLVELPPPALEDPRADATRLRDALTALGEQAVIPFAMLTHISERLRAQDWRAQAVIREGQLVALLPAGRRIAGFAADIGTTKLAGYLVDLASGETLAQAGLPNPQISYGEDVVSRIAYANARPDGARTLQQALVAALNDLLESLCLEAGLTREQMVEVVLVGNTVMHHSVAGLPLRPLGEVPFVAAVGEALTFPAAAIGLRVADGAQVYLPPNMAGYVGADHTSMLLASLEGDVRETTIALDIGTNTEISLFHDGGHWCCSCASGPAFEGAHIHDGMRAAPGAIERVLLDGESVDLLTVEGGRPVGICGSGILDAVAELLRAGLLDARGAFRGEHGRLRTDPGPGEFVLARPEESGHGREVVLTRRDINEIQLAKGAIRAGVEVLLAEAGIRADQVRRFIVAGAFGTYLDLRSAVRIGMFPDIPLERFTQVGNAAGAGARQMLLSRVLRQRADHIGQTARYIELTGHPAFMDEFLAAVMLK